MALAEHRGYTVTYSEDLDLHDIKISIGNTEEILIGNTSSAEGGAA